MLVTGGTSGLGALVARHLAAEHGVGRLLLVSRRGRDADGMAELEGELERLGCEVSVAACDAADRDALEAVLRSIPDERPLTAVVHAAGVLDDGTIDSLDAERLDRVLAPKVDAALNLHELTAELDLAAFVLFSSVAATLGGAGQGNYAAANAFLDALAQHRRARGLPATSLAWGLWAVATGMAADLSEADQLRMARQIRERMGMTPLLPQEGLELFDAALGRDDALLVPVSLDFPVLRARARAGMLPGLLTGLVRAPGRRRSASAGALTRRLAEAADGERDAVVLEFVREQAASVLGHSDAAAVEPERMLLELGLDSLGGVELRNRLSAAAGLRLPPALALDHPTPAAIAAYLSTRLEQRPAAAGPESNGHLADAGTLTTLLRAAEARGALDEAVPLLTEASKLRPAFASVEELDDLPSAVTLATGAELPRLVCIPSFLAGAGPHQFARFARRFEGARTVTALPLPGFRAGEPVPASRDAAIEALARSARLAAGDEPFVLVGYSIGGAFAHAVAERLEGDGAALAGVVLIDTYELPSEQLDGVLVSVMGQILGRGHDYVSVTDDGLMAMAAYMRLLPGWESGAIAAPSLLLRPERPLGGGDGEGAVLPAWRGADRVEEVAGDHFSIIEDGVGETARVADAWLARALEPAPADD